MKWVFLLVVLINIVYLGVNISQDTEQQNHQEQVKEQMQDMQLLLLSEVKEGKLQNGSRVSFKEGEIIIESDGEDSLQEKGRTEPLVVTEKRELPVEDIQQESEQENTLVMQQGDSVCYRLKEMSKEDSDRAISLLSEKLSNNAILFLDTPAEKTYYRIYIPPVQDVSEIDGILARLDTNGLKDHYVMAIDGKKNAIALGVFKSYQTAIKIAEKANVLGFTSIIEAITKDKESSYTLEIKYNGTTTDKEQLEAILRTVTSDYTSC